MEKGYAIGMIYLVKVTKGLKSRDDLEWNTGMAWL